MGISVNTTNTNENKNLIRIGYDKENNADIIILQNGSVKEDHKNTSMHYRVNNDVLIRLTRVNGVYTGYVDNFSQTISNPPSNPRYVQLESWSTVKTLQYSDFKVKQL